MDARNKEEFFLQSEQAYTRELPAIGAVEALRTLRRGWRFPVFGVLIGLTCAVLYLIFTPTLYKSTARIMIDTSMDRYLQASKLVDEPVYDDTQLSSQLYILSSESTILPVVRSMKLAEDSEFVGSPNKGNVWERIKKAGKKLEQSIGWNPDSHATIDPDVVLEQRAIETFLQRLTVYREDVPNVINVTFASADPNKAASIANSVADTYIAGSLEAKSRATKLVTNWLQDRMMELKVQAEEADLAMQNYTIPNKLANTGNVDLSTKLANARIATAEAKARLDAVKRLDSEEKKSGTAADALTNGARASVALNNNDIVRLRSEYRDVAARAAELESTLGRGHAAVIRLGKRMVELRAAIRDQEQLIIDSYANEYQVAKTRESELAAVLARAVGEAGITSQTQVKMRELESSADTLRALYNSFLQKYKEITTIQSIPIEHARIITRAVPPLHKSYKKGAAVLAGSVMLGLLLGAGGAIAKEWWADVFRSPKSVEQVTNTYCALLPMIDPNQKRAASFRGGILEEFVLDAPFSRFTETIRHINVLINNTKHTNGAKVIGVVSSVPGEGKTTIASNLAALLVASSGARVLIIDSDVHLRRLTAKLAPDAREGLIEALVTPSRLDALVLQRESSGLDVLPCVLSGRIPNAAELLGSAKMAELLAAAREAYDYIIIEIAPIMSVVDVKVIERFIDGFIFVVEWGHTQRSVVQEALSEAQIDHERLIGIVLNKVDPIAFRSIEAYKGERSRDYYQE